jgi:hypothetical protein
MNIVFSAETKTDTKKLKCSSTHGIESTKAFPNKCGLFEKRTRPVNMYSTYVCRHREQFLSIGVDIKSVHMVVQNYI